MAKKDKQKEAELNTEEVEKEGAGSKIIKILIFIRYFISKNRY